MVGGVMSLAPFMKLISSMYALSVPALPPPSFT
jgi:hypothetical protein